MWAQTKELALFSAEGKICHVVFGAEERHEGNHDVQHEDAAGEEQGPRGIRIHRTRQGSNSRGGAVAGSAAANSRSD